MKIRSTLILILFSGMTFAEAPGELQGTWVPDIEESILLMERSLPEMDSNFLREKYLPNIKTIITEDQFIRISGTREIKAEISLEKRQGDTFSMILSSDSNQDVEVEFVPANGGYIMHRPGASDGSDSIVWVKQ